MDAPAGLFAFDPPDLAPGEVTAILAEYWGVHAEHRRLRGERSHNSEVLTTEGARFVLHVVSASERDDVVDLQTTALVHLERGAPEVPVPRVVPTSGGSPMARIERDGASHLARLLTYVPGEPFDPSQPLPDESYRAIGALLGRVAAGLSDLVHPAAEHFMPWDIANGLIVDADFRGDVRDPQVAEFVAGLDGRLDAVASVMRSLPRRLIHNDGHAGNLLRADTRATDVTGLIDFGDLVLTIAAADVAIAAESFATHHPDPGRVMAAIAAGYQEHVPLTEAEIDALPELVLARSALGVLLAEHQVRNSPHLAAEEEPLMRDRIARTTHWAALDPAALTAQVRDSCQVPQVTPAGDSCQVPQVTPPGAACQVPQVTPPGAACQVPQVTPAGVTEGHLTRNVAPTPSVQGLVARRRAALAPSYQLFYDDPVELVRGEGVWVTAADGERLLDCYNNVPSVGHAHPRVVDALARQAGLLNTHTRYLHPTVVELAERLGALLPGDLGVCYFVCTGTEANDLAVQIARTVTGHHGVIVSEHSYHGNSELVHRLSTDSYPAADRPEWLGVVEPPNVYRGPHRAPGEGLGERYAADLRRAGDRLTELGHGTAAWMVDTSWDSNGVLIAPDGYVAAGTRAVRESGGLLIADEVQAGYCRMGTHMWGHTRYDVVPDIVTLGKPMGAGHPVAAVITTPAIAHEFARRRSYFNTFGGNPVSAAVALAVLDVIDDEHLLDHSTAMGVELAGRFATLAERHEVIGNVQGSGLFWGLDLVADRETREPIGYTDAKWIVSELRRRRVLAGVTGRHSNVLKIRPPLPFASEHADVLVDAIDAALASFVPSGITDRRTQGAEW